MNEENKLRRQQESLFVATARKALNEGDATQALSLIEQMTEFWPENLITLMSIIGFKGYSIPQKKQANYLFNLHLKRCTNILSLTGSAIWLRNPKRADIVPGHLKIAIDAQRKLLEPSWNGTWQNPGLGHTNEALAILKKQPHEIHDTNACLIAATQSSSWIRWINRYLDLGGSTENPKYLKFWVAKAVPQHKEPSLHTKCMLRKFTALGSVPEVRSFLRNITPIRNSFSGKNPNWKLAKYALLLYCECERLEHTIQDWVHISKSALHLNHGMVERMAQRVLAGLKRDSQAEEVFQELVRKNGVIKVTESPRDDIGPRGNPIWQSVYRLLPVNATAKRVLFAYSRQEMDS